MAKEVKQLRKYYLLTDESMKKLREIENIEKQFSAVDRRLKKILYNRRLSAHNKYLLYAELFNKLQQLRQNLQMKYNTPGKKPDEIKVIQAATEPALQSVETPILTNEISRQPDLDQSLTIHRRAPTGNASLPLANRTVITTDRLNVTSPSQNRGSPQNITPGLSPVANATSTPTRRRSPMMQYRDSNQSSDLNDSSITESENMNTSSSYTGESDESFPEMDNLAINGPADEHKPRDPFWMSTIDWDKMDALGNLEPQTPQQQRRLSVAAMASASRKRAAQRTEYDEQDGAVGGNTDVANLTIVDAPAPQQRNSELVTIPINGVDYNILVEDEDDFRDFAAEEVRRDPNILDISSSKFEAYKAQKDKEFKKRLRAEKKLKRKVAKRDQHENLANELEQAGRVKNLQQQETNWNARHTAAAAASTPKARNKTNKTPKSAKNKQRSMSEVFKKTKTTPTGKQTGSGIRWVQLK